MGRKSLTVETLHFNLMSLAVTILVFLDQFENRLGKTDTLRTGYSTVDKTIMSQVKDIKTVI